MTNNEEIAFKFLNRFLSFEERDVAELAAMLDAAEEEGRDARSADPFEKTNQGAPEVMQYWITASVQ